MSPYYEYHEHLEIYFTKSILQTMCVPIWTLCLCHERGSTNAIYIIIVIQ